jgi:integrase
VIESSPLSDRRIISAEPIQGTIARLKTLTPSDLEAFVKAISNRCNRASLEDGRSVYLEEQVPGALPWEKLQAFLTSIDCSDPVGLRDYTMFFLMAIYGLRAGDVAALTLDDIHLGAFISLASLVAEDCQ